MSEIWKDIEGYEGIYQVSNLGRVRSLDRIVVRKNGYQLPCKGQFVTAVSHKGGYIYVGLTKDGRKRNLKMHRLVAAAFIPNPDQLPEVNHKDEDKTNNRTDNLEWCSRPYNLRWKDGHIRRAEKNWRAVQQIDANGNVVATYPSITSAAQAVGISTKLIGNVCAKRVHQKTAGGYRWRFAE